MHRFFISNLDQVEEGKVVIVSEDLIHQFTKVLRFRVGEKVVLLDNSGYEFEVELGEPASGAGREKRPKEIVCKVLERRLCDTELPMRIILAQAILKNFERFEWVLQKGTELGVSEFIPLITHRTERKFLGKLERMERILREAAEQSGRGVLPVLGEQLTLAEILARPRSLIEQAGDLKSIVIFPHPGAKKSFKDLRGEFENWPNEIVICIGPEGGFSEEEVKLAAKAGAHLVNLGPRILRAETAGIVVAALIGQEA